MNTGQLTFAALLAGMLVRWREAVTVAVATVVVALALSLVLPSSYRAAASFVTTDAGVQLPRGLGDLAAEPGLGGLASQLGLGITKDPSESPAFYVALLNSRELLTRLVLSRFPDPQSRATWNHMAQRWVRCAELFDKQSLAAHDHAPATRRHRRSDHEAAHH